MKLILCNYHLWEQKQNGYEQAKRARRSRSSSIKRCDYILV